MTQRSLPAFMCAMAIAFGCGGEAPPEVPLESVHVSPVAIRTVPLDDADGFTVGHLPAVATAKSDSVVAVASPCEGRVIAVHVDEGDAVEAQAALADIACLDAGVLGARQAGQSQRIRALERRLRELRELRTEGLVDLQRVVEIERELLAARTDHTETKALIARAGLEEAAAGDAIVTLVAPQDGVVSHISSGAGNLIDRVGMPLVTLGRIHTTRVVADVFTAPIGADTFYFRGADGHERPLRLISVRAIANAPDDLTSTRLRLTFECDNMASAPLRVGTRGQVDVRLADPTCRVLPAHAVRRHPRRDGSSAFCVFAEGAAETCISVVVRPGDTDDVAACGIGLPAVGAAVLSHLPSWTTDRADEGTGRDEK